MRLWRCRRQRAWRTIETRSTQSRTQTFMVSLSSACYNLEWVGSEIACFIHQVGSGSRGKDCREAAVGW